MVGQNRDRPQPSVLVRVGIDVGKSDISEQRPGDAPYVAASRNDRQPCADETRNQQPCPAIVEAQQQPWILAQRKIAEHPQPGERGQELVPRDRTARRSSSGGNRAEIVIRQPGCEEKCKAQGKRNDLPAPFTARWSPRHDENGTDQEIRRRGKNEGERRRQQPADQQGKKSKRHNKVARPIAGAAAGENENQCKIQYRGQMSESRYQRIPIQNSQRLGEGGKEQVEVQLRGCGGGQPGKSD